MKDQTTEKILDHTFKHLKKVLEEETKAKDKTVRHADRLCRQRKRRKSGAGNREAHPAKKSE